MSAAVSRQFGLFRRACAHVRRTYQAEEDWNKPTGSELGEPGIYDLGMRHESELVFWFREQIDLWSLITKVS